MISRSRFLHSTQQGKFVLTCEIGRLVHLHLCDLIRVDARHAGALGVNVQHHLDGLVDRHVEDRFEHPDDELHRGVVVVVEEHLEGRRLLHLLAALRDGGFFEISARRRHPDPSKRQRPRLDFHRRLAAAEKPSGCRAGEGHLRIDDSEHGRLPQTDHGRGVLLQELKNPLLARLALVRRGGVGIEVVRIDLEWDEAEGVEGRRLDDRHVVRRPDRRRGDVRSRARADVRQRAGTDAEADRVEKRELVHRLQQPERIPAADEEGIDSVEVARALQLDDVDRERGESLPDAICVALVIGEGERRECDPVCTQGADLRLGMIEEPVAVDVRGRNEKEAHVRRSLMKRSLAALLLVSSSLFAQTVPPPPEDLKTPPSTEALPMKVLTPGTGSQHPTADDFVHVRYAVWKASTGSVVDYTRTSTAAFVQMSKMLPGMWQMFAAMTPGERPRG